MRVLFCGTPDFAALVLDALLQGRHEVVAVLSQPSRPQGRGLRVEDPPAVRRAREAGLPVLQPVKLHAAETLREIQGFRPDLILTAAFGRILRPALLSLPRLGCWNVHASLLPRHRGASPVPAVLLAGDAWTGITIFRMDEGLDTGPILLQEMTPVGLEETSGDLTERLAHMGGRLLVRALDLEESGTLRARPQPSSGATYAPILRKEDGRVAWNRPVEQVERMVRAVTPWPGAWSLCQGKRLRIHRIRPLHRCEVSDPRQSEQMARPGTLLPAVEGIGVACLPGVALLCEVQSEGGKRLEATEWMRGSRVPTGTRLDPPA